MPLSPQQVRHCCINNYVHFILYPTYEGFLHELPKLLSVFPHTPNLPQPHQHVLSGDSLETCHILVSNHWYQFNYLLNTPAPPFRLWKLGVAKQAQPIGSACLARYFSGLSWSFELIPSIWPAPLNSLKKQSGARTERAGSPTCLLTIFFCSMGQAKFIEWLNNPW